VNVAIVATELDQRMLDHAISLSRELWLPESMILEVAIGSCCWEQ